MFVSFISSLMNLEFFQYRLAFRDIEYARCVLLSVRARQIDATCPTPQPAPRLATATCQHLRRVTAIDGGAMKVPKAER